MAAAKANKTIAYLRVSTLDQNIEKNKADILHFANHQDLGKVEFVEETASGPLPGENAFLQLFWMSCKKAIA